MSTSENTISRSRIIFVFLLITAFLLALLIRLTWIQLVQSDDLKQVALNNRTRDVEINADRGIIYDRNGRELVVNVAADTIVAFPPRVLNSDPDEIATTLAEVLEIDYDTVLQRITRPSYFSYVTRRTSFDQGDKIRELKLPGIAIIEENQRFYPKNNLAAHVLGFAGIDNQGLEGIEASFDRKLRGALGRLIIEHDAAGREIPHAVHKRVEPVPGYSLYLTIDETMQHIVERELNKIIEKTQANAATIILMEPNSGEILALGNRPTFDPNHYNHVEPINHRNIAVSNSFEPGSTFKIITLAAAIEEAVFDFDETFYCPGYIMVGNERINCWNREGHGEQTFIEVIENSCNPGIIELGLRVEKKEKGLLYQYIKGFGFGQSTGIELPGEAAGIMIPEEQLRQVNVATISMGQGISITPIQLITAVAAIANDGVLVKPQIVRETRDNSGETRDKNRPQAIRNVLSKQSSELVLEILASAVEYGTGGNAQIDGYMVAGKTGTAQKVSPKGGYASGEHVASFAGIATAGDFQIAGLVVVDNPKGEYYGGQIAAPAFRNVIADIFRHLELRPDVISNLKLEDTVIEEINQVLVPNIVGKDKTEAEVKLKELGLNPVLNGDGEVVASHFPSAGNKVSNGAAINIYLKEYGMTVVVPDVTGKTIREVSEIFRSLDIKLEINDKSTGFAVNQSVEAGESVEKGTGVTVDFKHRNN